jgi:hypothetical protein
MSTARLRRSQGSHVTPGFERATVAAGIIAWGRA